jgi:hypothetical protein
MLQYTSTLSKSFVVDFSRSGENVGVIKKVDSTTVNHPENVASAANKIISESVKTNKSLMYICILRIRLDPELSLAVPQKEKL